MLGCLDYILRKEQATWYYQTVSSLKNAR